VTLSELDAYIAESAQATRRTTTMKSRLRASLTNYFM
jgi:hypothetical protein